MSGWQTAQAGSPPETFGWPVEAAGGRAWQLPQTRPVLDQVGEGALPWQVVVQLPEG